MPLRSLFRCLPILLVAAVGPGTPAAAQATARPSPAISEATPGRPGGRLVVALRAEPKTLNPVTALDDPSRTVLERMMADLAHIDRATQEVVPALAESWTASEDGRRYRLVLRRGLRFSDGNALDADDVVFTFQVYTDPEVAAPQRELLIVEGEPIVAKKVDERTVDIEMAAPYAVGARLFDSIAVLPRHLLETAWKEGRLGAAWGLSTPPAEIAGAGPFRLKRFVPGERLELERNPHYWKVDARGQRLPYLEELHFLFVANEEAQSILFRAGETHLVDSLSPESFAFLAADAGERPYELRDLGPGLVYHMLFFNLNRLAGEGREALLARQRWFEQTAFRRAVSLAIDREAIVRLVFRGLATPIAGEVTPANRLWRNEALQPTRRDVAAARRLLAEAGFVRREDGELHDAAGRPVTFTVATNASSAERVQMATLLQEDLREIGITLRIVPLEFRALLDRIFESKDYDAVILGLGGGDVDPNSAMNVWLSSGSSHLFRLGEETPATPWEAEIDELLRRQLVTLDRAERGRLFDRVQEIIVEQQPFVYLVSPNVLVGAHSRLGNFRPVPLDHPTLWNVEELYWQPPGEAAAGSP